MELCSRVSIFCCFIFFSAGIALICTSLSTEHWLLSHPVRAEELNPALLPSTTGAPLEHVVEAGLFGGYRQLDYGLGPRLHTFSIHDELSSEVSFWNRPMWLGTVVLSALAVLWALIGVIFSLVNTVMRPVEEITGPRGLFLWSGLAFLCSSISVLLFVVQYFTSIKENVLLEEQISAGFSSSDLTELGYSFWLHVGAAGSFACVIVLLLLSNLKVRFCSKKSSEKRAMYGGDLMY